jgi:hypothetical protein
MHEIALGDFFLRKLTPSAVAQDAAGSKKKIRPIDCVVEIEDREAQFWITGRYWSRCGIPNFSAGSPLTTLQLEQPAQPAGDTKILAP